MTHRIRWFKTNNTQIRVFTFTSTIMPLGSSEKKFSKPISEDSLQLPSDPICPLPHYIAAGDLGDIHLQSISVRSNLWDSIIKLRQYAVLVNALFEVNGVIEVSLRPYEVGIKLASAFDWDALQTRIEMVLKERVFSGQTEVAVEYGRRDQIIFFETANKDSRVYRFTKSIGKGVGASRLYRKNKSEVCFTAKQGEELSLQEVLERKLAHAVYMLPDVTTVETGENQLVVSLRWVTYPQAPRPVEWKTVHEFIVNAIREILFDGNHVPCESGNK